MYWGLTGTLGTQARRGIGAILGVYWEAGRDSRYSGARRGIGVSGALGGS